MAENPNPTITRVLTWSTLAGGLTAYTHFFGYSYLRGKLSGVGFEGIAASIHLHESLYQATEGLLYFLSALFKGNLGETLMLQGAFFAFWGALAALAVWGRPWVRRKVADLRSRLANRRPGRATGKLREGVVIAAVGAATGFSIPFLSAFLIVAVLALAWTAMGLGSLIGFARANELIKEGVCKPFDWPTQKFDVVRGCVRIELAGGSVATGTVLFRNEDYTYLLSNDQALEISKDGRIRAAVPFHKRPEKELLKKAD